MDEIKRKVYLDLFASPLSLLPVVGGLTALLGSWAIGGSAALTFGGMAALLAGVGIFATRLVFGLEKMTNRAHAYVVEKQQEQRLLDLRELNGRLQQDADPRTQRLLEQLWTLYRQIEKDVKEGRVTRSAISVMDSVDQMFHVCVDYLDRSHALFVTASQMRGAARAKVMAQREELIREVASSTEYLEHAIDELHRSTTSSSKGDLAALRAELDETIRAARRAEEITSEIGEKTYDESEFE